MRVKNKDVIARSSAQPPELAGRPTGLAAEYRRTLSREMNPVGAVQEILLEELARRAANMRELDNEHAALRGQFGAILAEAFNAPGLSVPDTQMVALAAASATDRAESLLRQGLAASQRFCAILGKLHELQCAPGGQDLLQADRRFDTELKCIAYLVRRYAGGRLPCRRCGARGSGSFITVRMCWQCGSCHAQTGLRVGTIMEHSALPLMQWFAAIRALLLRPSATPADIATIIFSNRLQTVRGMIKKIRRAAAAENASDLLAELDQVLFYVH